MTPNLRPLVDQVQREHPEWFQINTGGNGFNIIRRVLELSGDDHWGHVGKTMGEGQFTPATGFPRQAVGIDGHTYTLTGVSHDAIFHKPTNQQIDCLSGGNDGSEPLATPSRPQWGVIPQSFNRVSNPWVPAPLDDEVPGPAPVPVLPSYEEMGGDALGAQVGAMIFRTYAEKPEAPNSGMGVWFWRMSFDMSRGLPPAAAVAKHMAELRRALGLPPLVLLLLLCAAPAPAQELTQEYTAGGLAASVAKVTFATDVQAPVVAMPPSKPPVTRWTRAARVGLAWATVAHGADTGVSLYMLGKYPLRFSEANPILAPLTDTPALFGAVKTGMAVAINYLLLKLHMNAPIAVTIAAFSEAILITWAAHSNANLERAARLP